MVVTISPSLSLYRIVVLPAASRPTMRIPAKVRYYLARMNASKAVLSLTHFLFAKQALKEPTDRETHDRRMKSGACECVEDNKRSKADGAREREGWQLELAMGEGRRAERRSFELTVNFRNAEYALIWHFQYFEDRWANDHFTTACQLESMSAANDGVGITRTPPHRNR